MKRAWHPIDVGGLRLYEVKMSFANHRHWNERYIVAAMSPAHARNLIEKIHTGANWTEEAPTFSGHALSVYQPAEWWMDGIPCEHERTTTPAAGQGQGEIE